MRRRNLLNDLPPANELEASGDKVVKSMIEHLWLPSRGTFAAVMHGNNQVLETVYADPIWSSNYLREDDLTPSQTNSMFDALESLATRWGFATTNLMMGMMNTTQLL